MTKGWTEERRKAQAERIRQTKPWKKSTGPKTQKGKARSSLNGVKHGNRAKDWKHYSRLLHLNRAFIKEALLAEKKRLALLEALDAIRTEEEKKKKQTNQKDKPRPPKSYSNQTEEHPSFQNTPNMVN